MADFYICSQDAVQSKLQTLTQLRISDDGWIHYYRDEISNEEWVLARSNAETLFLKKLPALPLADVINIVLTSTSKNNLVGSIYDLLLREQRGEENFRSELIEALHKFIHPDISISDQERVKLVIHQCELLDSRNRRDILGKHYSEIEKDASYYANIAARARLLLKKIEDI